MRSENSSLLVGVISDTHGLLRQHALEALRGSDLIVHAGDVGRQQVLDELRALAPVFAVRGNVDREAWADTLPETEVVAAGPAYLYVLHDLGRLGLDPAAGGFSAVISGHSHRSHIEQRGGVLYLNPGAAGPRRFTLPVTVALLRITAGGELTAEVIPIPFTR